MFNPRRRAVPTPHPDLRSLHDTTRALKENMDILTTQTPDVFSAAPTWGQLVDLGIVTEDQLRAIGVKTRSAA